MIPHVVCADMAELADAPDLGSGGRPCRFESCYPQKKRPKPLDFIGVLVFLWDGKGGGRAEV